jgi:hypothetical protein
MKVKNCVAIDVMDLREIGVCRGWRNRFVRFGKQNRLYSPFATVRLTAYNCKLFTDTVTWYDWQTVVKWLLKTAHDWFSPRLWIELKKYLGIRTHSCTTYFTKEHDYEIALHTIGNLGRHRWGVCFYQILYRIFEEYRNRK